MGLDFSHCDAHWAYSGFDRFRRRLAAEIGINLDLMDGFSDDPDSYHWDKILDPIKPLLNHSDCEGELTPAECLTCCKRLRELVDDWDSEDYDKQQALELAEGMQLCAEIHESLSFM